MPERDFTCVVCGADFISRCFNGMWGKTCSRACTVRLAWDKRGRGPKGVSREISKTCAACGGAFTVAVGSERVYCSTDCRYSRVRAKGSAKPNLKACEVCGARVTGTYARTCSKTCMSALVWRKRGVHAPVIKSCPGCGTEMTLAWGDRERIFCSSACYGPSRPLGRPKISEVRQCLECGVDIDVIPALAERKKFCSQSCSATYRVRTHAIQYPTSIEVAVYAALDLLGVEYVKQKTMGRYVPDAWVPAYSLAIEADGTYWHSLPERVERDRKFAIFAEKRGYRLLRLDEKFIKSLSVRDLAEHINGVLSGIDSPEGQPAV